MPKNKKLKTHQLFTSNPRVLVKKLLDWYHINQRILPWRASFGQTPNSYYVWLSEMMLQQTTVATVKPYFTRFIKRWPTLKSLSEAHLDDILWEWQGLGYYRRARLLHQCAELIVKKFNGQFPKTEQELISLPGLGPYSSAAIAAIAFDQPATVVDGNIERIMVRFFAIETPLPQAKSILKKLAGTLTPIQKAGDYAQALMDLGSLICTPKNPKCVLCPWQHSCQALKLDKVSILPIKQKKIEKPTRYGTAFWIEKNNQHLLLERRPSEGLLGNMMGLPTTPWRGEPWTAKEILKYSPCHAEWNDLEGSITHIFTHFKLELSLKIGKNPIMPNKKLNPNYMWTHTKNLHNHALPTVMKKIITHKLTNS
ncbi:MAG: A/G-specific adenine glycosylase [Alphaproteobacteria bacterium]|nr:A/G-specific adenine glycosylase [Alphaproteobacteria bacterium]